MPLAWVKSFVLYLISEWLILRLLPYLTINQFFCCHIHYYLIGTLKVDELSRYFAVEFWFLCLWSKKKNLCWLWCCFSKHLKVDVKFLFFFFWSSINCHIGKYVFYGTVTLELLMMNFRVYSECGNKIGILIFCIMYSSLVCTYLRLLISFDITFFCVCVCFLIDGM